MSLRMLQLVMLSLMVDLRVWDGLNWLRNGSFYDHITCDKVESTSVKLTVASPLEYHNIPNTGLETESSGSRTESKQ
jgi:hypothetical protein